MRILSGFLAIFIYCSNFSAFAVTDQKVCSDKSLADVVAKLMPSVVNISTTQNLSKGKNFNFKSDSLEEFFERFFNEGFGGDFSDNRPSKVISLGSGFLIDGEGHIVTNYHVIDNAEKIRVTIGAHGKKEFSAKVVGYDKLTDLAVLKVKTDGDFPYVKFGSSENMRVGDQIIAVGNAFGLGGTVTTGIISAKGRYLGNKYYEDFIQTDASINKGNSGGPMFNMNGEVVGVNTMIVSPSGGNVGVGFAIPADLTSQIVEKIIKHGVVKRAFLGITFQPLTDDIAAGLGIKEGSIIVMSVSDGSPASKAGIKIDDVIKKFNGVVIDNPMSFPKIVSDSPVGKPIPVEVLRSGKLEVLTVVLDWSKPSPDNVKNRAAIVDYYGISVSDITDHSKKEYGITDDVQNGVVITKIKKSSKVANLLRVGDVIVSINGKKVNSVQYFLDLLSKLRGSKNPVVFLVSRHGNNFYVSIEGSDYNDTN